MLALHIWDCRFWNVKKRVFEVNPNSQPDLTNYTYLVEKQLKPEARKRYGRIICGVERETNSDD